MSVSALNFAPWLNRACAADCSVRAERKLRVVLTECEILALAIGGAVLTVGEILALAIGGAVFAGDGFFSLARERKL